MLIAVLYGMVATRMLKLINSSELTQYYFISTMFLQKSFTFSVTAISSSYDICDAFQNQQHFTIVGNFLYDKIKSND